MNAVADRCRAALNERGSVTAEVALVLPVLVLLLALVLGAISAQGQRVLLQDATADAVRLIARSEDEARAADLIARVAPSAQFSTEREGDLVCASSSMTVTVVMPIELTARACALAGGR